MKVIHYAHELLNKAKDKEIAVDFTLGNGKDSNFLCQHFQKIYGFDIQQKAINNSKLLLNNYHNMNFILDCHSKIDNYISYFNAGIFNLGYLPGEDTSITTLATTTLIAVEKALSLLTKGGILIIVVYVGHQNGQEESKELIPFLKNLNRKQFCVVTHQLLNANKAPYIIEITKN